jgi:hypothetical protein
MLILLLVSNYVKCQIAVKWDDVHKEFHENLSFFFKFISEGHINGPTYSQSHGHKDNTCPFCPIKARKEAKSDLHILLSKYRNTTNSLIHHMLQYPLIHLTTHKQLHGRKWSWTTVSY